MKRILIIVVIVMISSTGLIRAQVATKSTTARQVEQQERISQGVHNKELTRHETVRLEREQKRIEIEKRVAKADGTVTPKEKRFLRRQQNHASKDIYKQKHDGQERGL
jgi:Ni/Co efflux regulator RcnB